MVQSPKLKNFSLSKLIQCSITLGMGIFTLVALCFTLVNVSTYIEGIIPITLTENGFDFLDMKSIFIPDDFQWGAVLSGIFCVLQLVAAIATIIMAILAFFVFNSQTAKTICKIFMILCLSFNVTYLIVGIVNISIPASIGYWVQGLGILDSDMTSGTTLAYIPLIISCLIFAGYIICTIMIKDSATDTQSSIHNTQENEQNVNSDSLSNKKQVAEMLKTYKDLLDTGVITQEEFDREKEKLLK